MFSYWTSIQRKSIFFFLLNRPMSTFFPMRAIQNYFELHEWANNIRSSFFPVPPWINQIELDFIEETHFFEHKQLCGSAITICISILWFNGNQTWFGDCFETTINNNKLSWNCHGITTLNEAHIQSHKMFGLRFVFDTPVAYSSLLLKRLSFHLSSF